jgi:hypothetical protein
MRKFARSTLITAALLGAVATTAGAAGAASAASHPAKPVPAAVVPHGAAACSGSDCVIYDLSTQSSCTEVNEAATYDSRWTVGLSSQTDQTVLGGHIVAYKIQYFSGSWSGWYVPGVNDIDIKFNTSANTERRQWSYFYDHAHDYIICK